MEIFLSSRAAQQLKKLPNRMHDLFLGKIETLATTPFPVGATKLEGRNGWRIRIGDYRILYTIDTAQKEVTILSIAHRKEAYRY